MNIKNTILHILKLVGFKTTDSLYIKQPSGTLICFPVALHNLHVYLNKIPPSFRKLKKICQYDDEFGTKTGNISLELFREKFNLVPTYHSKLILKKGGLLYIKNGCDDGGGHVILCYPDKGNKNKYVCVNFGFGEKKVIKSNYEELKKHFVKFDCKPSYRGFYLKNIKK